MTTKPRYPGIDGGPLLARRLEKLFTLPRFAGRGWEAIADALGVSLATVYRWRAGEATRISRAVGRVLLEIEKEGK